jgi:hypothetical protein
MWWTCMRYATEQGVTVGELAGLVGTHTNLGGLQRWRYITLAPDPADPRPKPPERDLVIRPTPGGDRSRQVWAPLTGEVEARWRDRLGTAELGALRTALAGLASQQDQALPDCLPILGYGLFTEADGRSAAVYKGNEGHLADAALPVLLSRVLLAFALEFEAEGRSPGSALGSSLGISLAVLANLVRVLDSGGVPPAELPRRSGVSAEAIAMAMGLAVKDGVAEEVPRPTGRGKLARLTAKGATLQQEYAKLTALVEDRWRARYGPVLVDSLRAALSQLADPSSGGHGPLWRGLGPYPDGWRASVRAPDTLPHYPMVLHRGGFPDGS